MSDELTLVAVLVSFFFGASLGAAIVSSVAHVSWRNDAIEHGFGLYCPNDGRFAWKGECGNE